MIGRLGLAGLTVGLVLMAGAAAAQTVPPVRPDDRTLGSLDAPVTLTAYVSTTCGHCADWHGREFPAFKTKYVDTGKVRVVYRDLFTPPGNLAELGVVMARCVAAERYDEALTALFRGQTLWQGSGPTRASVITWLGHAGASGGLTGEQMNDCINDAAGRQAAVDRNAQSAADGVQGTPTFFVNGRPMPATAGHDLASFEAVIDPLLVGG